MSPYNWVIFPLTQPQVANQQKQIYAEEESHKIYGWILTVVLPVQVGNLDCLTPEPPS